MMRMLTCHPGTPARAVESIAVHLDRDRADRLTLRYEALGAGLKHLALPGPRARPERRDGLWQATCFELFVRVAGQPAYVEYNFAPSRDWACYGFDAYRAGMAVPRGVSDPRVEPWLHLPRGTDTARGRDRDGSGVERDFARPFFSLGARAALADHPALAAGPAWQVGLSAVIVERDGRTSYWALAHPPGAPDFHADDCFALDLAPARGA